MAFNSLESLRLHGLRILLLCSLIWTVLIGIGGMMIGNERAAPAMLLSALANILPTWMAWLKYVRAGDLFWLRTRQNRWAVSTRADTRAPSVNQAEFT